MLLTYLSLHFYFVFIKGTALNGTLVSVTQELILRLYYIAENDYILWLNGYLHFCKVLLLTLYAVFMRYFQFL